MTPVHNYELRKLESGMFGEKHETADSEDYDSFDAYCETYADDWEPATVGFPCSAAAYSEALDLYAFEHID